MQLANVPYVVQIEVHARIQSHSYGMCEASCQAVILESLEAT
jgi:hypothetical protein